MRLCHNAAGRGILDPQEFCCLISIGIQWETVNAIVTLQLFKKGDPRRRKGLPPVGRDRKSLGQSLVEHRIEEGTASL